MGNESGRSRFGRWRVRRPVLRRRTGGDERVSDPEAEGAAHDDVRRREEARDRRDRVTEERIEARLTERLAQQWAGVRAARLPHEPVIEGGRSNYEPARVPYGVDLAAQWSWRFIVIAVAGGMILWTLRFFGVVVLPLVIALLIAALAAPAVTWLQKLLPRGLAALLVVIVGLGVVGLLLTFVGQQVSQGVDNLSAQVVNGLEQIRTWLRTGPLHASDSQINDWIQTIQGQINDQAKQLATRVGEVSSAITHIVVGFVIVLFGSYFFLADGHRIWTWVVRLFPRAARLRVDSSGRVAWHSVTQFVRATVLVAAVDAAGIAIVALVLGLPFVGAIGVLVFLGAFVPMVGATVSGTVAVLVALVAEGPVVALIMLAGVIGVQQLEAHVLQPFLMGRFVSVHPLAVIAVIAMGVITAGIAGAIIAVPLAAALNAVVQHLANDTDVGEDGLAAAASDPGPDPALSKEAHEELESES